MKTSLFKITKEKLIGTKMDVSFVFLLEAAAFSKHRFIVYNLLKKINY